MCNKVNRSCEMNRFCTKNSCPYQSIRTRSLTHLYEIMDKCLQIVKEKDCEDPMSFFFFLDTPYIPHTHTYI